MDTATEAATVGEGISGPIPAGAIGVGPVAGGTCTRPVTVVGPELELEMPSDRSSGSVNAGNDAAGRVTALPVNVGSVNAGAGAAASVTADWFIAGLVNTVAVTVDTGASNAVTVDIGASGSITIGVTCRRGGRGADVEAGAGSATTHVGAIAVGLVAVGSVTSSAGFGLVPGDVAGASVRDFGAATKDAACG